MQNIVEDNDLDNIVLCHEVLSIAQEVLSERDYSIVLHYILDNGTNKQLGADYGISGSRIIQIYNRAIRTIIGALSYEKMVWMNGQYYRVIKSKLLDTEKGIIL
jgi:DNA-directed RNA polymerase specialized sigma subunit